MERDGLLTVAKWLVRALVVLNLVAAAVFVIVIAVSFPSAGAVAARLAEKYGSALDAAAAIDALRLALLLGIAVAVAAHLIFAALLRILATVEAGDPFGPANARRLETIGVGLLAIQVADLCFGGLTAWIASLGLDFLDWQPSLTGWLATLLIFVLARVFRAGNRMREDLEGTI